MGRKIFNPESFIWKPLGWFGDLVVLSLLWCLCSIPLVTLGPATAALYDTVVHCVRREEGPPFSRFFGTFRRELKEGVLLTLLWAAVALALGLGLYALRLLVPAFGERGAAVTLAELLLAFLYLAAASWVFPTLSRFAMGVGAVSSVCARLAPGHALRSAALALMNALVIVVSAKYVVPLMFAPALASYLSSYLIEPVFRQYEQAQSPETEESAG